MTLDGTFDQNSVINQLLQNESFVDVVTLITGKPDQSLHMYSVLDDLRFEFQLPHPILSPALATDKK